MKTHHGALNALKTGGFRGTSRVKDENFVTLGNSSRVLSPGHGKVLPELLSIQMFTANSNTYE